MNFDPVRVALAQMLRREIDDDKIPTIFPHPPEIVDPPCAYLTDATASVDLTMQQRVWIWNVSLNILVANVRDYSVEQQKAEELFAIVVPAIDRNWILERDLLGTGIQIFGLEYNQVQEGGIRIGNQVYAGISVRFNIKVKLPLDLQNGAPPP